MIWILTTEYNDYDQNGEYFVAAFKEYPTLQQLYEAKVPDEFIARVKNGGGRSEFMEDQWWHLRRYEPK